MKSWQEEVRELSDGSMYGYIICVFLMGLGFGILIGAVLEGVSK